MNRLLTILICLCLSLILGIGFLWPKYQDLKILGKKIGEKQFELQSKEEYFSNLSNISEELKKYEISLSKIDAALPPDPFLPLSLLFDFLQKASSQSGLVLKSISPVSFFTPYQKIPEIEETKLSLVVSGSYSAFKNFLSTLEKSARLIKIENIAFSGEEKETPFTFNLRIKVYSY